MAKDFDIGSLLRETGITPQNAGELDRIVPASLEEIQTALVKAGQKVTQVHHGTNTGESSVEDDGTVLYLFTPEGKIVVSLGGNSGKTEYPLPTPARHFGGLPPKPDGYKDGGRVFVPDSGSIPNTTPLNSGRYVGELPRKPRY